MQHEAAGVLKKGADAASRAEVQKALKLAKNEMGKALHKSRSGGVAAALRGTTSRMAEPVNQTSLHVSQFLQSFGPKASTLLTHSGETLACKFSGDCSPTPDGEDVVAFDPEDPQSWAFWGFALFLVFLISGMAAGILRCMYCSGRKVHAILLSEAMVPLTEASAGPSAREPTIATRNTEGLLG